MVLVSNQLYNDTRILNSILSSFEQVLIMRLQIQLLEIEKAFFCERPSEWLLIRSGGLCPLDQSAAAAAMVDVCLERSRTCDIRNLCRGRPFPRHSRCDPRRPLDLVSSTQGRDEHDTSDPLLSIWREARLKAKLQSLIVLFS